MFEQTSDAKFPKSRNVQVSRKQTGSFEAQGLTSFRTLSNKNDYRRNMAALQVARFLWRASYTRSALVCAEFEQGTRVQHTCAKTLLTLENWAFCRVYSTPPFLGCRQGTPRATLKLFTLCFASALLLFFSFEALLQSFVSL